MNIIKAVLGVSGLADHVTDLTAEASADDQVISATTLIDAEQKALGDMAEGLGLLVMHSKIFASYKKMEMVDYDKYTVNGVIKKESFILLHFQPLVKAEGLQYILLGRD